MADKKTEKVAEVKIPASAQSESGTLEGGKPENARPEASKPEAAKHERKGSLPDAEPGWKVDVHDWALQSFLDLAPSPSILERMVNDYNATLENFIRRLALGAGDEWLRRAAIQPQILDLETQLAGLRRRADDAAKALLTEKATAAVKEEQIKQLQAAMAALREKEALAHLLARVSDAAKKKLLEDEVFRAEFGRDEPRGGVCNVDRHKAIDRIDAEGP